MGRPVFARSAQGRPRRSRARGLVLIDALVAVLVFALGVLAIVGLQVVATQQSSQAQYRAEATMLANALISSMWVTDRNPATLSGTFATGGAGYDAWAATVRAALPGATANPPEVDVVTVAGGPGAPDTSRVTVTVQWQLPSAPAGDPPNRLVMVAQIR